MIEDDFQVVTQIKENKESKESNKNGNEEIIINKENNNNNEIKDKKDKNNENETIEIKDINENNNKSIDLKNSENQNILDKEENYPEEITTINDNFKLILNKIVKDENEEIINTNINQF